MAETADISTSVPEAGTSQVGWGLGDRSLQKSNDNPGEPNLNYAKTPRKRKIDAIYLKNME